jgi:hypothetical protein
MNNTHTLPHLDLLPLPPLVPSSNPNQSYSYLNKDYIIIMKNNRMQKSRNGKIIINLVNRPNLLLALFDLVDFLQKQTIVREKKRLKISD